MFDEHAKWSAPITQVILTQNPMSDSLEHPAQSVANYRGAQVTDMHFLGDIRRRIVNYDGFRCKSGCKTQISSGFG